MHPKNSTTPHSAQPLLKARVGFGDTPIANLGHHLLSVEAGNSSQDALQVAKVLSSGLAQICQHMHDVTNDGEVICCDGISVLGFIAETVSALVWAAQKGADAVEVSQ